MSSVLEHNCLNKVCYSVNQNTVRCICWSLINSDPVWACNLTLLGHLLLSVCKEGEIYRHTTKFNYCKCATVGVKKINLPAKCPAVFLNRVALNFF